MQWSDVYHHLHCCLFFFNQVSIEMPNLKIVRNVVERMKALGFFIIVSANCNGMFRLKAETETATIVTHFKNLTVEHSKGWCCITSF